MCDMAVERVSDVPTSRSPVAAVPMGISAQLADARAALRYATPAGYWDDVLEEVKRLQTDQGVTLLAALRIVYDKLLTGWVPPRRR